MQVICIVDSINNLNRNLDLLSFHFGNNIHYIVKSELNTIFSTFKHKASAIFGNNLSGVLTNLILNLPKEDIVVYRTSLNLDKDLLTRFLVNTNKNKVINVIPKYNVFEQLDNNLYNTYVKTMFKTKDSLASAKLQYLPSAFVEEILSSHIANKLFEVKPNNVINLYVDDKTVSNNLKTKPNYTKLTLIFCIATLFISACLIASVALFKPSYILIFTFIILYLLDIIIACMFRFKIKFDNRFLK